MTAICAENAKKPVLVSSHRLSSSQRMLLKSAGDRYEKAGKERLVLNGTLDSFNNGTKAGSSPARITIEFPDQVKIENLGNGERVNFDGTSVQKSSGSASKQDLDFLETLLNDSTDGFFAASLRRASIQSRGAFFKFTDNGKTGYCNLFELREPVKVRGTSQPSAKIYCFDSFTGLLRSVRYYSGSTKIEIRFGDWIVVNGQSIPKTIARLENGKQTLGFGASVAATVASAPDGLFARP